MNNLKINSSLTFLVIFALFFASCGGGGTSDGSASDKKEYKDQVVIHNLSDPEGLHPTNTSDANATEIKRFLFQKLLAIDHESLELLPWMAKELPTVEVIGDNEGMRITYNLKPDMTWDDGKPITSRDAEFTFKLLKNSKIDCGPLRPYFEFIKDIELFEDDPHKFVLVCDGVYMLWDHVTGNDTWIIPEHFYDPEGLMRNFSIADFADPANAAHEDERNIKFAQQYNDVKYHREKEFMSGSGPYTFDKWETDQKIVLTRKDNWYGNKYKDAHLFFHEGPAKVIYKTINDQTGALTALKAEKLDVYKSIKPSDWAELPNSEKFNKNFNRSTPPFPYYSGLAFHLREKKFADKTTRQALAHLVDADRINETILYGLNVRTIGPISPYVGDDYNKNIEPYKFDVAKAKDLLKQAGWEDTNGDGTVDRIIDEERVEFVITFNYNKGNDIRENVGLAFQEAARGAGIKVEVIPMEWSVYLEKLKAHQVEMWYQAWVMDCRPSDPKQIWHTESYNGGSNYTGFGTAETDQLIEDIRKELDPAKRKVLYDKWQEILHDEVPYIFLYTGKRRNAIHNRFTNLNLSARDPGYWAGGFQLAATGNSAEDN